MATYHIDIAVTPTITAGAYTAGMQIDGLQTLTGVNLSGKDGTQLQKVVIIDKSGQSAPIDVLLFNDAPAVGADHAAVNISNADMATKCIGNLKVTAAMYSAISGATASVAAYVAPNMPIFCKPALSNSQLYAVLVCRDTPTYTSTSDLTIRFHFSAY